MIKKLIIKLRKKPKVVRDHVALVLAGVLTFGVFASWAITLPNKFSDAPNQPAELFSTLKKDLSQDAPDLGEIVEELKEVVATSSAEWSTENDGIIFEEATIRTNFDSKPADPNAKPIRIATTSHSSSSPEGQNILE